MMMMMLRAVCVYTRARTGSPPLPAAGERHFYPRPNVKPPLRDQPAPSSCPPRSVSAEPRARACVRASMRACVYIIRAPGNIVGTKLYDPARGAARIDNGTLLTF